MPAFIITIDTEGDNAWARPRTMTTANARYLPRFQRLCERYGLKPTYLTNYEMARCPAFQEFGADLLRRGTGEVGMHLHAWDSPPIVALTADDVANHPYLFEFAEPLMGQKVRVMTDLLEETFGRKMVSHRAGRWGMNETYARLLVEHGYLVDCSVTPHVSWRSCKGDPNGRGGPDYVRFPERAYWMDLHDISRAGDSPLLEVPLTVIRARSKAIRQVQVSLSGGPRVLRGPFYRLFPPTRRLVPDGHNLRHMRSILRAARADGRDYIEFGLHSSELMPGGSERFSDASKIDALYDDLEALFAEAASDFRGATLHDFYKHFSSRRKGRLPSPAVWAADDALPSGAVQGVHT